MNGEVNQRRLLLSRKAIGASKLETYLEVCGIALRQNLGAKDLLSLEETDLLLAALRAKAPGNPDGCRVHDSLTPAQADSVLAPFREELGGERVALLASDFEYCGALVTNMKAILDGKQAIVDIGGGFDVISLSGVNGIHLDFDFHKEAWHPEMVGDDWGAI
jgi:hypothetical protein